MIKVITINNEMYKEIPLTKDKPLNLRNATRLKELYKEKYNLKTKIKKQNGSYSVVLYKKVYN